MHEPGIIKSFAAEAGLDAIGIASADAPARLAAFAPWVEQGYAGRMAYLNEQVLRRSSLRAVFPWARSVICAALAYDRPFPYSVAVPNGRGWISRYAWGADYHDVLRRRLERLAALLASRLGKFRAHICVDTAPLVERAFAAEAGLGSWGKNTCLLDPALGSWFFLGEIVTDLDLPPDRPRPGVCGRCTACLDACPTGALVAPYVLDARRCISYLTIELKDDLPADRREGLGRHVFGCDICQDVCPWNRRRRVYGPPEFEPRPGLFAPDPAELARLDQAAFSARFKGSPVKRAKRRGLLRNAAVVMGNLGDAARLPALAQLAQDPEPLIRDHALWALNRLQTGSS